MYLSGVFIEKRKVPFSCNDSKTSNVSKCIHLPNQKNACPNLDIRFYTYSAKLMTQRLAQLFHIPIHTIHKPKPS